MPIREAIVNNLIPQEAPKPIPERIAITRSGPKPKNAHQPNNVVNNAAAESATPEASVTLSPQVSALARKEQAFRQREQALKQREKDLEAKLADAEQFGQLKTKISAKDFSEMEKLGLDYEEYAQYKVQQLEGADPLAELKNEVASLKKSQEENAEEQFEETKKAYGKEITTLVASNPDFSSIKELKAEGHVLQLFLDTWEEEANENYTIEDACKEIEAALVEQGKRFSSLPKLKPAEGAAKVLPLPKTGVKTLTNQMQPAGESPKPAVPLHTLSEAERYAEARRRAIARRNQQG